jgi:radical SAM/Cys-rich protein
MVVEPFALMLKRKGLELVRGESNTLQVNVGFLCNQACRHCHLEAGPASRAVMSAGTVDELIKLARRFRFQVIDITGGAPEMNSHLGRMISELSPLTSRLMLRSNLTAITDTEREFLLELSKEHRVVIVASLPSLNTGQTDSLRGKGVWTRSIETLRRLNSMGYGIPGSGLELHLVSNPAGAFMPSPQAETERKFREQLEKKSGIVFNNLFTFANVPLGRFRQWLDESGNFEKYMEKLASSFNGCTLGGLMCRTLLSVSWDGYLYDCDFNQAGGIYLNGKKTHLTQLRELPAPGSPVAVSDHCYACTAGTGFT